MKRIRIGQTFRAWGREWTVMRRERGRRGEARTMYVIGYGGQPQETRSRATVLAALELDAARKKGA